MKTKELILNSEHGLHLRVAGEIVKLAKSHECRLSISCDGCSKANACSILQLLTLGAVKGTKLEVQAEGPDEAIAIKRLSDLLADGAGI